MRELLLIAVVVPLCVVALFRPRIGLYAYIWFALMRPDVLAWSNGRYPYSLSLAVCTLIGSLVYLPRFRAWFTNPIAAGMLLLQVPMVLSVLFAVNPALCYEPYYFYLRVVLTALLIVVFVTTEEDLRHLFLVIALSLGAIGAKFGFWALLRGGARYSSGYPDSMMSDNNTLALGLAMVLPLCWYGVQMTAARSLKALLILFGFGSVAAVVMTHSRGGALCAGAGLLLMALRSKRRIAALLWICILAAPAVYVVKDSYVERLESTTDTADASIQSRNAHRAAAVRMWKDYPWFGVGYGTGNYVALISNYLGYEDSHVAHNTYVQVLADSGIFAFAIYNCLLFGTIAWLQVSARRAEKKKPGTEIYPYAMQAAFVSFAIGSFFLSRVSFDLLYMFLASAGAWWVIERRQALTDAHETPVNENDFSGIPQTV